MPAAHVLLLGGVRSGKSRRAAELATAMAAPVDVIATACADDEEMRRRIEAHRRDRPSAWRTLEEPLALASALRDLDRGGQGCVIVDCLTLWLTNLLHAADRSALQRETAALYRTLPVMRRRTILVANETGLGVVPVAPLARQFIDLAGAMHQRLASLCQRVELLVAGLPLVLKGHDVTG